MAEKYLYDALDYVPYIGTAKTAIEAGKALAEGDYHGALSKGAIAVVGGVLDGMTLGAGGAIGKAAAKQTTKEVVKQSAKVVLLGAASAAERAAVRATTDYIVNAVKNSSKGKSETGDCRDNDQRDPNRRKSRESSSCDRNKNQRSVTDNETADSDCSEYERPQSCRKKYQFRRRVSDTDDETADSDCSEYERLQSYRKKYQGRRSIYDTDNETTDSDYSEYERPQSYRKRNQFRRSISDTDDSETTDSDGVGYGRRGFSREMYEDSSDEIHSSQKYREAKRGYSSSNRPEEGSNDKRKKNYATEREIQSSQRKFGQRVSTSGQQNNNNNNQDDKDKDKRRPKRGHHIINNDILKIYKKIIEQFCLKSFGFHYSALEEAGIFDESSPVFDHYHYPLPPELLEAIENLVVRPTSHLDDPNAERYGEYRQILEEAVLEYMETIHELYKERWDRETILERKRQAREILVATIEEMIIGDVFVDQAALEYWLGEGSNRRNARVERANRLTMFEEIRENVRQMLRALVDKAEVWVKQIIKAAKAYYKKRGQMEKGKKF